MPKVTAIVPNYNHSRFLERRISSVLEQTYQDFEVILMDDASPDNSVDILKKYATHPKVRDVLLNTVNTGIPFKQWNKGVAQAQGDFIWIAESDDYADPRLLERLVPLLEQNPGVGVAYCQSFAVNSDDEILSSLESWTSDLDSEHWKSDYICDGPTECGRYVALKCTIPNASGAVFRRAVYERAGGAEEDFRLSGDWMLWAKLMMIADVAFVAEPLNYFRMHNNTVRSTSAKSAIALREAIRIYSNIKQRVTVPDTVQKEACERLLTRWILEISKGRLGVGTNMEIYRLLRQVDNQLLGRFANRMMGSVRKRFAAA